MAFLQYYLMIYERDTGKNLIDTYGFYGALSFLHYLISIVAILVVIDNVSKLERDAGRTAGTSAGIKSDQ